jgi:hypothetical protein
MSIMEYQPLLDEWPDPGLTDGSTIGDRDASTHVD